MDVTIYGNVFDIQLQYKAYLTVYILYRCLIKYKHSNHAAN